MYSVAMNVCIARNKTKIMSPKTFCWVGYFGFFVTGGGVLGETMG